MFEPTLSNLFSVSGIKNTNIPEIRGKVDTLTWYCEEGQPHSGDEGAQYAYYAQSDTLNSNGEYLYINQHTLSLDDSFACLECCDLKGSPCKY
ncbi:MAG: hypothetical protein MJ201_05460 [Mycoplasmoidaceae bacterium]|nr:hypothetical protein [Mycoplasmoidaceae bacterium]